MPKCYRLGCGHSNLDKVAGSLRRLARLRSGADPPTALDFETAKARRLLRLAS